MTDGLPPPAPAPGRVPGVAWLLGTWRAQRLMWSEAWCVWTRRPLPSVAFARELGDGRRFPLRREAWMSVLVPMVVFSQFVDLLVAQGAVHVAAAGPRRMLLHALLLFVSLWMVVWAVSLRSATRRVDHVLGPHALTLAIGFKHLCRLPLAAIAEVRAIDHKAARNGRDWLDVHGLTRRDVTCLQALDAPTLLIALKPDAIGAWTTRNGVRQPLKRWIAVHADQPDAMAAAVAALLVR
jgi:hypothetical protein